MKRNRVTPSHTSLPNQAVGGTKFTGVLKLMLNLNLKSVHMGGAGNASTRSLSFASHRRYKHHCGKTRLGGKDHDTSLVSGRLSRVEYTSGKQSPQWERKPQTPQHMAKMLAILRESKKHRNNPRCDSHMAVASGTWINGAATERWQRPSLGRRGAGCTDAARRA
jgi:hypothetical protein